MAAAVPVAPECADAMQVEDLQALLDAAGRDPATGEQNPVPADGLTVVEGTIPQTFSADILSIDYGGVGIDHDLILAELSGLGIDSNRGVWAGMSGSPVYIGDQLIGAVSYGFSWGPNNLAGITPAAEMFQLTTGGVVAPSAAPEAAALSVPQRMSIAAQTDQSVAAVPSRLPRLQVPLALNVSSERLAWLQREAAEDNSRVMPVAGSGYSVSAAASTTPDISAGSNFAAALSYGDITSAGTGTTTWTCGDEALAFGHPFFWGGKTSLSLHNSESVNIVDDATLGSYKLARLGAPVGIVDQDRFTGLHGLLTGAPAAAQISSLTIAEHPDGELTTDTGATAVPYSPYVPFVTFIPGFTNIDFLLDRYVSPGSSELTWVVDMTHQGQSYRFERTNKFNSESDISVDSMFEPWGQLEQLAAGQFGPVTFDDVFLRAEAVDTQRFWRIKRLEVRRNGEWSTPDGALRVNPGRTFKLRAVMHRYEGGQHVATRMPAFWFTAPRRMAGSYGEIVFGNFDGGGEEGEDFCFFEGECDSSSNQAKTFQGLINRLENAPRNDELRGTMTLLSEEQGTMVRQRRETLMTRAVQGGAYLPLRVRHTAG